MRMKLLPLLLTFIFSACASTNSAPPTNNLQVKTSLGAVQGVTQDGADVFWGLPYAKAPVEELRWQPPHKPEAWTGIRDGSQKAPICPQTIREGLEEYTGAFEQSEDCLYLNVWRPSGTKKTDKLPVMLWIHGGSFVLGAGSWSVYDGPAITDRDVMLVTINYRLGMLGRFAHPSIEREQPDGPWANYGLMDQVAALEWVQENISNFGGNPDNVTIFGYSAGGVSVNYLMAAPAAEGLFQRAIAQSGGIQVVGSREIYEKGEERLTQPLIMEGEKLAKDLKASTLEELRQLPVEELLSWQKKNTFGSLNPVRDGVLIPKSVGEAFNEGETSNVDFISGANSWEASLLQGFSIPPMAILGSVSNLDAVRKTYEGLNDNQLMEAWFAENTFVGSAWFLAREQSKSKPDNNTYLYSFNYVPEAERDEYPGAAHGNEVPYIFQTLPGKNADLLQNDITAQDKAFANIMTQYWTNFAKTGDPNSDGLPVWPEYENKSNLWMLLDDPVEAVSNYKKPIMDFLEERYLNVLQNENESAKE